MTIYILLFAFIMVLLFFEVAYKYVHVCGLYIRTKDISFYGIFIFILLLGVLKSPEYGYDWESYKQYYFDHFQRLSLTDAITSGVEPGFALLTFLLTRISTSYWFYRTIIFLISYILIAKVIKKFSKYVSLSFLLFVSFGLMTFCMFILRQAIAVAIILFGIEQLLDRKYIKYMLIVLIACLFHYTAIIAIFFIPFVWFSSTKLLILRRILYIIGSVLTGEFLLPKLVMLYKQNDYSRLIIRGEGKFYFTLLILLFFIIGYLQRHMLNTSTIKSIDSKKQIRWFEISFITIYFQIIALYFSLFNRVTNYPLIITLIYLPNCIVNIGQRAKMFVIFYILLICAIMYYVSILSSSLIPYISVLN